MKSKLIFIFLFLVTVSVVAQEATLTAKVSKNKLGVNQRLRIEFTINKQGGDHFSPPNFTNFKVVGGPSQSVSQSWINGKSSFAQSYTYIIKPNRKADASPLLFLENNLILGSLNFFIFSEVPSVEQSSTIMTSTSVKLANIDVKVSSII